MIVTATTELMRISFFNEVGFKLNFKSRDGVSPPYLDRELVRQQGGLVAKSSPPSHSNSQRLWGTQVDQHSEKCCHSVCNVQEKECLFFF